MKEQIVNWTIKKYEDDLIKKINVEKFYAEHQDAILKLQESKRLIEWKENCEVVAEFPNPKTGKMQNYYKFKSSDLIPTFRYGMITDWLIQNGKKLTKDEQAMLIEGLFKYSDKMVNTYNEKKRVENLNSIHWCAKELYARNEDLMFHPEIMLELVAYSIIREDENPAQINEVIHKEKLEVFKKEGGVIPFYLQVGLGQLYPNWKGSTRESKLLLEKNQEIVNHRNLTYRKIAGRDQSTETDKSLKTG